MSRPARSNPLSAKHTVRVIDLLDRTAKIQCPICAAFGVQGEPTLLELSAHLAAHNRDPKFAKLAERCSELAESDDDTNYGYDSGYEREYGAAEEERKKHHAANVKYQVDINGMAEPGSKDIIDEKTAMERALAESKAEEEALQRALIESQLEAGIPLSEELLARISGSAAPAKSSLASSSRGDPAKSKDASMSPIKSSLASSSRGDPAKSKDASASRGDSAGSKDTKPAPIKSTHTSSSPAKSSKVAKFSAIDYEDDSTDSSPVPAGPIPMYVNPSMSYFNQLARRYVAGASKHKED